MSKDYERLAESSEAFVYVAIDARDGETFGSLMNLFRQFH
jgi:hypothetical protein